MSTVVREDTEELVTEPSLHHGLMLARRSQGNEVLDEQSQLSSNWHENVLILML